MSRFMASLPTPIKSFFVKSEPRDADMTEVTPQSDAVNLHVKNESPDERNVREEFRHLRHSQGGPRTGLGTHGYGEERGFPSLSFTRPGPGPPTQTGGQKPKQETVVIAEPALVIDPQFEVFSSMSDINYAPENALKEGIGMVKTIKQALKQLELGSKLRQDVWDREIEYLEGQGSPKTLIAVCGATGAGKSSILNAILDDNIVPTSGMRACTAVVTELSYHKKQTIDADISFLSQAEWKDELAVLIHDIEEGNAKRLTDLKSDAGVAWQKVHAVYPNLSPEALPKMDVDQLINHDQGILKILGTTKQISAEDAKTFGKEINKYIDSKDQKQSKKNKKDKEKAKNPGLLDVFGRGAGVPEGNAASTSKIIDDSPALWPLIRQVNIRCRARALSTGAILVDLPGVADANAARNSIAKDYMKKCNCIWILAPITRAVDDKTARDLLGDAFRIQLMNGNYDHHAITFIATKCDDISCSEVIRALKLEEDPTLEDIEDRLREFRNSISSFKKEKNGAGKVVKELEAQIKNIREQIQDHKDHITALENGEQYTSKLVKRNAISKNKKRKKTFGGQKSSKRRRSAQYSDNDFLDDDSEDLGSSDSSCTDDSEDGDSTDNADSDVEMLSDNSEGSDEEDDPEALTVDRLKERIKQAKLESKAIRAKLNTARARKKEFSDLLSSAEKNAAKVQKEKNGFCSLKRSEYSRGVLKEDFRAGLKDLDDANAEARDPENFDPSQNIRDYEAIDLPVFTCSSRDYVRLKGQVKGDGASTCFSNVEDTGIPALQKWCHQLTIASRERAARLFLTHVKAFAQSIQTYVEGNDGVTANDREHLRKQWESQAFGDHSSMQIDPLNFLQHLENRTGVDLYSINPKVDAYGEAVGITPRLCMRFAEIVDKCVNDLKQNFKDGLEAKCSEGAVNASGGALITLDDFTSSMHWATYRATLRRHGSWRRDLNLELTNPFTKSIAHSWSKVFESDLFAPFQAATLEAIKMLVKEVEDSAVPGLKDRAKVQGGVCLEEACVALEKTVDLVKATMTNEQKEVSRCVAPHVQTQLLNGYDRAMEEYGPGSVARQKALFHAYLQECKDHIFDDGANVVLDRLTAAADAIGETLDGAMGNLAQKIEVSLAVLWEGTRDSSAQRRIREAVIDVVKTVQQQVKLWTDAALKQQADKITADTMDHD